MCIYLGDKSDLTYTSQEHVLPAGLGCHTKLKLGDVSDQANGYFSPIERRVLERSLIQIPRIIKGPGKRGSLSPKKATTSDVSVIGINESLALGYMKGTEAFILNHFIVYQDGENKKVRYVQGNETVIPVNQEEKIDLCKSGLEELQNRLRKWKDYYSYIHIDNEAVLITYFKDKVYVAAKTQPTTDDIKEYKTLFQNEFGMGVSRPDEGRPSISIDIRHGFIDTAKVAAKSCINTLAYLFGSESIKDNIELNELKNAIFADDESILKYVEDIPNARVLKREMHLENDEHACLLEKRGNSLLAYVLFYDYGFVVDASINTSLDVKILNGIVCDWKNERDYKYLDFLKEKGILT